MKIFRKIKTNLTAIGISILVAMPSVVSAQALTSTVRDAVDKLTVILMAIMVGAAAWAGFELKNGNPQGVSKLMYCIVGIIIIGSANAIVNLFKI